MEKIFWYQQKRLHQPMKLWPWPWEENRTNRIPKPRKQWLCFQGLGSEICQSTFFLCRWCTDGPSWAPTWRELVLGQLHHRLATRHRARCASSGQPSTATLPDSHQKRMWLDLVPPAQIEACFCYVWVLTWARASTRWSKVQNVTWRPDYIREAFWSRATVHLGSWKPRQDPCAAYANT